MNNKDTKIVLILLSAFIAISMVTTYFLYTGVSLSNSSNTLWKAETRLSGLRASNSSAITGLAASATGAISFVPMIVALGVVIAICVGLYGMIQKEKKKSRVAFVKGRDIKKIAPDAYAQKKKFERDQIAGLKRNNRAHGWNINSGGGLDNELTDLARIAKVNAMRRMAKPDSDSEGEDFS